MQNTTFPRTKIGELSVSRMIMGTNNIMGGSHRTKARDRHIKEINNNRKAVAEICESYLSYGVDTIIGCLVKSDFAMNGIRDAEQNTGKKITVIELGVFDTADTHQARTEAGLFMRSCAAAGIDICMPLHYVVEKLVNKAERRIDRIEDYLAMIREHGMTPGLSAHMPEIIEYADSNEYDVESYIQIYNASGFLMQMEVETVHRIIWDAKKPVLTIKPLAAGHLNPFVGLTFVWNSIRSQDMVAIGCMTPDEVHEVVEYSLAAIEHRRPVVQGRSHQYAKV
ncbi:MAG: hypothetical protein EA382_16825 [Spirochaetaceae bacterium]|nr:MAG: hypothetical protein EA382_16825 [Spirochaetaceae bacterium]